MRLYNGMTRTKEELMPVRENTVTMYVCGPTAYDDIHIGNGRTFLSFDVIRRYLLWRGYDVKFVQNITDIDDKIINRANEEGRTASEVSAEYTKAFIDISHKFGLKDPDQRPKATEEIPAMIAVIERLIDQGNAYESQGDVYFSVRSFPGYGKLSGRNVDDMLAGARVEIDDRKRDPLDFTLWKAAKPGEPSWESPWGLGRPGWHTECAAMSEKYLGLPMDIHGGGSDLSFPHHENEIAQAESAWHKPFAHNWMHSGMLQIDSEKMSKSLGNFSTLKEVLEHWDPNVVRLMMLQTHYRSPLDYSEERLDDAVNSYERITTAVRNLAWAVSLEAKVDVGDHSADRSELERVLAQTREQFMREMDDDFNTAGALGGIFSLVSAANSFLGTYEAGFEAADLEVLRAVRTTLAELLGVLGIQADSQEPATGFPPEVIALAKRLGCYDGDDAVGAIEALMETRKQARICKDWAAADAVRDGLAELNFTIEDTPAGARVIYKA